MAVAVKELTHGEYELFRNLVYAKSGISLGSDKIELVKARLGKRLRRCGFRSYTEYYNHVLDDASGEELGALLDAISTNFTKFFRGSDHFDLLEQFVTQWAKDTESSGTDRTLRIWSAACSSGEEPYSIAMTADAVLRQYTGLTVKILATDLSIQMLSQAKLGLFEPTCVDEVPIEFKQRYVVETTEDGRNMVQVATGLRKLVTFSRFNLMTPTFPFRYGFHVIFCRNVMIYFDRQTQLRLVDKFADQLRDDGYLMIGHSESINKMEHRLSYVAPAVYRKSRACNLR